MSYNNNIIFTKYINPKYKKKLLHCISTVMKYFPELKGKNIKVGLSITAYGRFIYKHSNEDLIYIEVFPKLDKTELIHIIAHELTHYTQNYYNILKREAMKYKWLKLLYLKKIPFGEKACDIYTYARSPLFVAGSTYLKIPKHLDLIDHNEKVKIHEIARFVIMMRNLVNYKNYIKLFEDLVKIYVPDNKNQQKPKF